MAWLSVSGVLNERLYLSSAGAGLVDIALDKRNKGYSLSQRWGFGVGKQARESKKSAEHGVNSGATHLGAQDNVIDVN